MENKLLNINFRVRLINYKNIFMCHECRDKCYSAYINTL